MPTMRRTPTAAESTAALLSGKRGRPEYRYRMYRSNISGETFEELTVVEGAVVSLSNFRDHTWELKVPMKRSPAKLDVFKDYVKLVVETRDGSTASWTSFPMGLYFFASPAGTLRPTYSDWKLVGRSPEAVLALSSAYQGYSVAAGTGALAAARQILIDRGVPSGRIDFPPTDVTLANAMFFDPIADPEGSRWLRIVNAILNAGGFYAVYCDARGLFKTHKIEDFARKAANVSYDRSWVVGVEGGPPEVEEAYDDERFANRVVVYSGNPSISPPWVGVAENHDPESPGSIENLGRVVQKEPIVLQSITSQAAADAVARAELAKASARARKLTLRTLPDPRRGPREVYQIDLSTSAEGVLVDGTWTVEGWKLPLDLSEMEHTVTRTVQV